MTVSRTTGLIGTAFAAILALGASQLPASAQGLNDPDAIDTIVGSDIEEEETSAEADPAKVMAAIDKAPETVSTIRKTTALDRVDIVYLTDSGVIEGGPPDEIAAKLDEQKEAIVDMRRELEGNAMLYHAIDSRQILIRDIVAVEFGEDRNVIIYAAAKPAAEPVTAPPAE